MKTEKQIALKKQEIAKKLLEDIAERDCITLSMEAIEKMDKWIESKEDNHNQEKLNIVPIIKKGYIKCEIRDLDIDDYDQYHVFDCNIIDNHVDIEYDYLVKKTFSDEAIWHFSCHIKSDDMFMISGKNYYKCTDYVDATCLIYYKQKRTEEEIKRYIDNIAADEKSHIFRSIGLFLDVCTWVNYLTEHPEEKIIERKPRKAKANTASDEKKESTHTSEPKKKTIVLNGMRVVTENKKAASILTSRQYHRVTETWQVRGHPRHYKNGKTVHIHPYEKGKGKENKKTKVKVYEIQAD